MDIQQAKDKIGKSGLVIFDGSCGACSVFIGEKKAFFEKYGFSVTPLQEPWVKEVTNLNEETLLQAVHLYTTEGKIVRGIDFFHNVASRVWWMAPVNLLLHIPFVKRIFAAIYDLVAKRRRQITRLCGLESRAIYKDHSM